MALGRIAAIHRYPVKAMMGEDLNAALVTSGGLAGDRAYAVVDAEGKIGTPKIPRKWGALFRSRARYLEEPGSDGAPAAEIELPDGERAMSSEEDIHERLSKLVGRDVHLISEKPPGLVLESPPLGQVPESDDAPLMEFPVPNGFFDLGSLHLLTTATLDRLRELSPQTRWRARPARAGSWRTSGRARPFQSEMMCGSRS
jgi:uncharacterized protein YcbX